jgi:hypothetical protein
MGIVDHPARAEMRMPFLAPFLAAYRESERVEGPRRKQQRGIAGVGHEAGRAAAAGDQRQADEVRLMGLMIPKGQTRRVGRHQQILLEVEDWLGAGGEDAVEETKRVEAHAQPLGVDDHAMLGIPQQGSGDGDELPGRRRRLDLNEDAPTREIVCAQRDEKVAKQMRSPETGDGDRAHRADRRWTMPCRKFCSSASIAALLSVLYRRSGRKLPPSVPVRLRTC